MKIKTNKRSCGCDRTILCRHLGDLPSVTIDRDRYPHDCHICDSPAWDCFGGGQECSNKECINYVAPPESPEEVDEQIDREYDGDGDTDPLVFTYDGALPVWIPFS